jgi:predicted small lipoprotein YifL
MPHGGGGRAPLIGSRSAMRGRRHRRACRRRRRWLRRGLGQRGVGGRADAGRKARGRGARPRGKDHGIIGRTMMSKVTREPAYEVTLSRQGGKRRRPRNSGRMRFLAPSLAALLALLGACGRARPTRYPPATASPGSPPAITWEHSHVVQTKHGMATFCVYSGPSVERVKEHAVASGLPADEVFDLVTDVDPADL